MAWSGNYEALCRAIDEKRFDQNIIDSCGYTIWHYLSLSDNDDSLQQAYNKYKFNKNKISSKYHHLLVFKTDLRHLIEKLQPNIEIPHKFICGISYEIMSDPVVTECGQIYGRKSIEKWLLYHNTDPITNIKLNHKYVCTALHIQKEIKEWLTDNI